MAKYGSDLIVDLMQRYGIEYVALNPGSSYRGLHDSIVNYGDNRPEIIECPHEKIAVAMAHGYAKATGKPMAAIVHDVVGLLHGAMAIYYAYLDRAPVLVLGATGPMDVARRRPHIDWIHTAVAQGGVVRDFTKWDYQPVGAVDVADSFARGYRIAVAEPQGPVYLCYDAGFQEDPLEDDPPLPAPDQVMLTAPTADRRALEQLAGRLVQAEFPLFVTDYAGKDPKLMPALTQLAELLGAGVIDRGMRLSFPTIHPLNLTGSPDAVERADLIVGLDVKDLYGAITRVNGVTRKAEYVIRSDCRLVEIGYRDVGIRSWSQEFQKLQPVDQSILGDVTEAVTELARLCRTHAGSDHSRRFALRAESNRKEHDALRAKWAGQALGAAEEVPIATSFFVREIWEAVRGYDWVLTANTVHDWARRIWEFDQPGRHAGESLGTATQIGISLGVALAHRGSGKLVVDIQPDGDLMFDPGALWVASHHHIPMLVVMFNNRAYYNDWDHQIVVAKERGRDERMAYLGMEIDNPAPDFTAIAQGFGWYAEGPVTDPKELRETVARAAAVVMKEGRPALVDVLTQPR